MKTIDWKHTSVGQIVADDLQRQVCVQEIWH